MQSLGPVAQFAVPGIENSLNDGCRMHAFSSGGGLRVLRIEKNGELRGYGEHPDIVEALVHVNEDYLLGGQPYASKYGEGGKYPHYLTGSSTCTTDLDLWVRKGSTFDVWKEGEEVVFELRGLHDAERPSDLHERLKTVESFDYTDRGIVYRASRSRFPNGEACASITCISKPEAMSAHRVWSYYATQTGRGPDFWSAQFAAFKAPLVELND